jgi:hypothetical protein
VAVEPRVDGAVDGPGDGDDVAGRGPYRSGHDPGVNVIVRKQFSEIYPSFAEILVIYLSGFKKNNFYHFGVAAKQ